MPGKPYSFRFPFDVRSTLESWRAKLSTPLGGGDFDGVIARLSDRDRAIEDYLSTGVAQGYLGTGLQTGGGFAIPNGAYGDIPGVTVTFTVPAGRLIKLTSSIFVENVAAAANTFVFTLIQQDGADLVSEYLSHGAAGAAAGPQLHQLVWFYSPTAGTHTVKTRAQALAAGMQATTVMGNYIAVEDIGPATRT